MLEFKDETAIPAWSRASIARAVAEGIMQGRDGELFLANEVTTRAEAVTVLLKLIAWLEN